MKRQLTLGFTALALAATLAAPVAFAADQCAKGPVTVGFLPKLDTDPYFQVARTGAEEAQGEIGGKVVQQAPSQATAEAQIEFINNLVSQKVDVIAIAGNDANAVAPALKRAAQQGVRVVSYDSDVAEPVRSLFFKQAKGGSLGRDDAGRYGPDDRLRRRFCHSLLDADGDEPERLDRLHEE